MKSEVVSLKIIPVSSKIQHSILPTSSNSINRSIQKNDIYYKNDSNNKYFTILSAIVASCFIPCAIIKYHKLFNKIQNKNLTHIPMNNKTLHISAKNEKITPEIAIERLNQLKDELGVATWLNMEAKNQYVGVGQNIFCLQEKIYDKLRTANYPPEGFSDIAKLTGQRTKKIRLDPGLGWHYRMPFSFNLNNGEYCLERISLNVKPDKTLIEQLDKYLVEHTVDIKGYYKTPNTYEGWLKRHDPITVYLHKTAKGTTVLDDIAKIAQPFVRSTGNSVLLGKKYANGCAWQLSPLKSHIQELACRIEKIFGPRATRKLLNQTNFSAGEVYAYNEILNKITGENISVLMP